MTAWEGSAAQDANAQRNETEYHRLKAQHDKMKEAAFLAEAKKRGYVPAPAPVESVPAPVGLEALAAFADPSMWEYVEGTISGPDCPDGHQDARIWLGADDPIELARASLPPRPATGARPMKLRAEVLLGPILHISAPEEPHTEPATITIAKRIGTEIAYRINAFEGGAAEGPAGGAV